jgi:hypothetical protein
MTAKLALVLMLATTANEDPAVGVKFNPKQLEKDFAPLPLFADAKGRPVAAVDNEVMVSRDGESDKVQAVYVVRAELKKVLDFYTAKLSVKPEKSGDATLGDVKYHFNLKPRAADTRVFRVRVIPVEGGGSVQITLTNRALTPEDPVPE